MCVQVFRGFVFFSGLCFNLVRTLSDVNECLSRGAGSQDVKQQYCLAARRDVKLFCPFNDLVLISGLQMVAKTSKDFCMKRVLGDIGEFCCAIQDSDGVYNAHCLQDFWNKEDKRHYRKFIEESLDRCNNRSQCVLNSDMFANLQKRIPISGKYASYFHVLYQCVSVPIRSVNVCSSTSVSGQGVHIRGSSTSDSVANKTCICRVTSPNGGDVLALAEDMRLYTTALSLSSDKKVKFISSEDMPLFGLREISSAKIIRISVTFGSTSKSEKIRIYVSGSNRQTVTVACGETIQQITKSPTSSRPVPVVTHHPLPETHDTVFLGHLPLVYIAAGSLFTVVIVVCILGGVVICRKSNKKTKRHQHNCPWRQSPPGFHQDPPGTPYTSVIGDAPFGKRGSAPMSRQTMLLYDKPFVSAHALYSSARDISLEQPNFNRPPTPARTVQEHTTAEPSTSYRRLDTSPGVDNDVSQLEAFLKFKETQ